MLHREFVYIWYYFEIQLRQIFPYWVLGMVLGSAVSVFAKEKIHDAVRALSGRKLGAFGVVPASLLGIASPLCMYGTIPLAAGFSRYGISDDWLAAFMMSSVLLNPQLIIYSAALGTTALAVRIVSCFLCGIAAGLLVRFVYQRPFARREFVSSQEHSAQQELISPQGRSNQQVPVSQREHSASRKLSRQESPARQELSARQKPFFQRKPFFRFDAFEEPKSRDTDPDIILRFLKNLGRNLKATGLYFLMGVALSALFQRYVPADAMTAIFGGNEAFGVLMAATIGGPFYACGGGTIPLLIQWLADGMSLGSASAFMITGPATKITNLGALKIVLGVRNFVLYLAFVILFSLATGMLVDLL